MRWLIPERRVFKPYVSEINLYEYIKKDLQVLFFCAKLVHRNANHLKP